MSQTDGFMRCARTNAEGVRKVRRLREQKLTPVFAVDNDVVLGFVDPKGLNASRVVELIEDTSSFSKRDQRISIDERVCEHILFGLSPESRDVLYQLPGHHTELWQDIRVGIHSAYMQELTVDENSTELQKQIQSFRTIFYDRVLNKSSVRVSTDELYENVPNQLLAWLGLGSNAYAWQRLEYIRRKFVLRDLPDEFLQYGEASSVDTNNNLGHIKRRFEFWHARLTSVRIETVDNDRTQKQIRYDALALTYLEKLNENNAFGINRPLILISASRRIELAVATVTPGQLDEDAAISLSDYVVHPFDFLDESHVKLTGELFYDDEGQGRLSRALEMLVVEQQSDKIAVAKHEFKQLWGHFLQASVIERGRRVRALSSTHIRRVNYVFQQIGLSSSSDTTDQLAAFIAEKGSALVTEAADVRILGLDVREFYRGATVLLLDRHSLAEETQFLHQRDFIEQLTSEAKRGVLIKEAGHRYTLHLLQARAMIWAGDWKTALRLAEFSLAIKDRLPVVRDQWPDVDGREATFLIAVCLRFESKGTNRRRLADARSKINEFFKLACLACENDQISKIILRVHELRARSEVAALDTVELLAVSLGSISSPSVAGKQGDNFELRIPKVVVAELAKIREEVVEFHSVCGGQLREIERFVLYWHAKQSWTNELLIRVCVPDVEGPPSDTILNAFIVSYEALESIRNSLPSCEVPHSAFVVACHQALLAGIGRLNSADIFSMKEFFSGSTENFGERILDPFEYGPRRNRAILEWLQLRERNMLSIKPTQQ
jgi:hypothetical protein